jgi:branched-chain amino acid transport system ATP-binding protein
VIEVTDLDVSYGKIQALRRVSLRVAPGEIVALLGANGAGKTTLVKAVCGLLPKQAGAVRLGGEDITRLQTAEIARRGLALVPDGRRLFGPLPVLDNLMLGAYVRLARLRPDDVEADLEAVFALFPRLAERRRQAAGTLSGGEQQMLAIGRALMARPRVILLDEPSIGLAPLIVREIFQVIRSLKARGLTVLLVEQNARMGLRVADRAYVMELGRVTAEGPAAALRESAVVQRLYLAG